MEKTGWQIRVSRRYFDPEFEYYKGESIAEYREQVLKWCQYLADQGFGGMAYPEAFGGQGDMASYIAIMETLSYHDLSMVIKFGVQFGLWGMSVYFLGTEKHHQQYLKDIGTLKLPGLFCNDRDRAWVQCERDRDPPPSLPSQDQNPQ